MTTSPIELVFYIDSQLLKDLKESASLFTSWVPRLLLYWALQCQSTSLVWDWKAFDPFSKPSILRYRSKRLRYRFDAASIRSSIAESKAPSQAQSLMENERMTASDPSSAAASSSVGENILWNLMQAVHDWPWTQSLGLSKSFHQLILLLSSKTTVAKGEQWTLPTDLSQSLKERQIQLSFLPNLNSALSCPSKPLTAVTDALPSTSFSTLDVHSLLSPYYWLYAMTPPPTKGICRAGIMPLEDNVLEFTFPFHLHLEELMLRTSDTAKSTRRAKLTALLENNDEKVKRNSSLPLSALQLTPVLETGTAFSSSFSPASCSTFHTLPDASFVSSSFPPLSSASFPLDRLSLDIYSLWLKSDMTDTMLDALSTTRELDPLLLDHLSSLNIRELSFKEQVITLTLTLTLTLIRILILILTFCHRLWMNMVLWTCYALYPQKSCTTEHQALWETPLKQIVAQYLLLLALHPNVYQAEEALLRKTLLRLLESPNVHPESKKTVLALVEDCVRNDDMDMEEGYTIEKKRLQRKHDERRKSISSESQPPASSQTSTLSHRPEMEIQRTSKDNRMGKKNISKNIDPSPYCPPSKVTL